LFFGFGVRTFKKKPVVGESGGGLGKNFFFLNVYPRERTSPYLPFIIMMKRGKLSKVNFDLFFQKEQTEGTGLS